MSFALVMTTKQLRIKGMRRDRPITFGTMSMGDLSQGGAIELTFSCQAGATLALQALSIHIPSMGRQYAAQVGRLD